MSGVINVCVMNLLKSFFCQKMFSETISLIQLILYCRNSDLTLADDDTSSILIDKALVPASDAGTSVTTP